MGAKLFQERYTKGEFNLLVQDLRLFDDELFFRYVRMNATEYKQLLAMAAPEIQKSFVCFPVIRYLHVCAST